MGLNKNQKRAVEYLDGPLLVLAGPGTGKTQLLSEKVAYILKNTDTNPENILCLTFTESGAMNMRERLKTIVGAEGSKVQVSTYHSFGTDVLSLYKNYSDKYDRQLDSPIDEVTQFKIVKTIRDDLPVMDILHGDNVKNIISVISSAKSAGLSAAGLNKIAKTNIEDSSVLSKAISPLLMNVVKGKFRESYNNAYGPIFELLKDYTEAQPIVKRIERSIAGISRDLKQAILEAESTEKVTPLTAWRNAYFEKDEKGNYRLKDVVANKKLLSIATIMEKYDNYLKDNGLFDYDDMIQEAVKILSNDEGFRLTLSERFEYIMLDEFQDTNPSQFMIIKKLTDYEKPNIMAVGDDDQAIYEFQGALATNLTDFQEHYGAEVIPLTENYRSTQEILDFSREIINQAPDRFADKELVAHKEDLDSSEIHRYEFRSSDAEFSFIAKKISELVKSGVRQKDIAVISYMRKYFVPFLPYLKSYPEINISYEMQNNLLEDDKIHQILSLAKLVDELSNQNTNNALLTEVLGYPFFNLPMLEVIKIIGAARNDKKSVFEYLASSSNEKICEVANFLASLVAKSFTEPLEIMWDYLIGATELNGYQSPLLSFYSSKGEYEAFSLYENLAALRGKLRQHFGDKSLKLSDLVSMVSDYESAEMPINTTSPYKDSEDAVSILTAHKAKGLEFEHVFIISADHAAWGKGKGNNNTLSLPKNLMQIRHTGTTDGEKIRVLYVALTRAKSHLNISNSLNDFNGKNPDRLEYLQENVEGDKVISPFLPSHEVQCLYDGSAVSISEKSLKNWLSVYHNASPDMRSIYKERVNNYRMSATSLTTFVDIVYAGPQEFFKREVLRVPSDRQDESLAFGTLVHQVFEKVTNYNIPDEDAIKYFLDELEKLPLESKLKERLKEKGAHNLSVSLEAFRDILHQGKAEVNLGPEKIVVSGVPLTGKIDHIVINEADKTIEVYDYKTAGYHKEKWQSHASLYKYMLQLEFYKLLLNNSPTYRKYKVTKAHILFVIPDKKSGEVYDKVYEYDPKNGALLLDLIRRVYSLVTTLEFMDDPGVFIAPNKSLGVKDIIKFIELLLAKGD